MKAKARWIYRHLYGQTPKRAEYKPIPSHLKNYPGMSFNRNQIINVDWKVDKKPNFVTATQPVKVKLRKSRTRIDYREVK